MSAEFKWSIVTTVLIVLTFVFPRARVLTVPLVFVLLLIWIYWVARIQADRQDRNQES
jgi:hypothetical protein